MLGSCYLGVVIKMDVNKSTLAEPIRHLLEGLGYDSLARWPDDKPLELTSFLVLELHAKLENKFDIRIRARDVVPEHFETLHGLVNLVERYLMADV